MSAIHAFFTRIVKITKIAVIILTVYILVLSIFFKLSNTTQNNTDNFTAYEKIKKQDISAIVNDPTLNKTEGGKLTIKFYRTVLCGLMGEECGNGKGEKEDYNSSLAGMITNLIIIPYAAPPSSGLQWAYNGLQNAGLIEKSYAAQGIGFASINMFAPIWKGFRNSAYLVLVIILIAIGFMIMFRMKLNPQTVISVENALPKIVLTLVLITFSFAIVGFLIDIMYLVTILGIDIVGTGAGITGITNIQNRILTDNALFNQDVFNFGAYFKGLVGILGILPDTLRRILSGIISLITGLVALKIIGALIPILGHLFGATAISGTGSIVIASATLEIKWGQVIAAILALILGTLAAPIFLWILFIGIILIGLIFLMVRIFMTLINALIMIILYLIFSPLILLIGTIPGQSAFSSWFKTIVGNLIVFPTVAMLFLVIYAIDKFVPLFPSAGFPSVAVLTPPLLAGIDPFALVAIINGAILLMIPDLAKLVKEKIAGKGPGLPIGPGIFFGGIGATVGTGVGLISQFGSLSLGLKALTGHDVDAKGAAKGLLSRIFKF